MAGSFRITNVNGLTVVVDIDTVGDDPTEPDVYSDADLATPVSLPATITDDTTFYVDGTGGFTLSVKVGGVELCGEEVFLSSAGPVTFSLDDNPRNEDIDRLSSLVLTALTGASVQVGQAGGDVGFYGADPVAQPVAIDLVDATASTNVAPYGFTQAQADALVAAVNLLITAVSAAQGGNGLTA